MYNPHHARFPIHIFPVPYVYGIGYVLPMFGIIIILGSLRYVTLDDMYVIEYIRFLTVRVKTDMYIIETIYQLTTI